MYSHVFCIILVLAAVYLRGSYSECNVCQTNGAACINSTSFYLCHGNNIPIYDVLYHCKAGFDCTSYNAICLQTNAARPASCGDTSLCGLCSAHKNFLFACNSRSTFRLCYGAAQPQSELGYCPDGYVCDASSDDICVPTASATDVTCDVTNLPEESTTNTPTSTVTDSTSSTGTTATPQALCDANQKIGVYQIPGDNTCREYIMCYMQSGVIYGKIVECRANTYFSGEALQCVLSKPSYCL